MSAIQFPSGPDVASPFPRPFSEIPSLWLKFTRMTEGFFAQEAPRASATNTLISIFIYAVVASMLAAVSSILNVALQRIGLPSDFSEFRNVPIASTAFIVGFSVCAGLVGGLIGFYLSNALNYVGARILGGTGDFTTQAYLTSLFTVPLGIGAGLVSWIPCAGALLGLAISIYLIILEVRAFKVVHRLTTGRAIAAVLGPNLLLLALFGCCFMAIVASLAPTIGNMINNIP